MKAANGYGGIVKLSGKRRRGYGQYAKKYYQPFMKKLGLLLTIHSCRHTCATMLDAAFVDLIIIQNILGHKNNTYYDYSYAIIDVDKSIEAINLI